MESPFFFTPATISICRKHFNISEQTTFASVYLPDIRNELTNSGEEEVARKYLVGSEVEKLRSFKYPKRKTEWLAGRVAVKNATIELCGASKNSWQVWQIAAKESGRPYTVSKTYCPEISISHSGDFAVAMATKQTPCGIDIQEIGEKIVKVSERFASEAEIFLYTESPQINKLSRQQFLTLLWSAKESIRKGFELSPIAGFMELVLIKISGGVKEGIIFNFTFQRDGKLLNLATIQMIISNYSLAVFIRP